MEVVDEFKKFIKQVREDEIKKNRDQKEDIITKQLKDLLGEEE
jgi:hypothetical protein